MYNRNTLLFCAKEYSDECLFFMVCISRILQLNPKRYSLKDFASILVLSINLATLLQIRHDLPDEIFPETFKILIQYNF